VRPPPLAAWGLTLVLAGLLLFTSVVLLPPDTTADDQAALNASRLQERIGRSPGSAPVVVVIGSSLTYRAFYFDPTMNEASRRLRFGRLDFLRFCLIGFETAPLRALVPVLAEAEPDVVVLESSLLPYLDDEGAVSAHRRFWRARLASAVRSDAGEDDSAAAWRAQRNWRVNRGLTGRDMDTPGDLIRRMDAATRRGTQSEAALERFVQRRMLSWERCPDQVPGWLDAYLRAAGAAGTHLLTLDIAGTQRARSAYPAEMEICRRELVERFQRDYGTVHLANSASLPRSHYSDLVHLNERGRRTFVRGFLYALEDVLARESTRPAERRVVPR